MGQQQLLLIVLGVIIVGIAVVVGINLFNANASEANRDGVVSDLNNLGAMAQQFYKKPASMGGGANTFNLWENTVPANLLNTANGTYVITPGAQTVTIVGTGKEPGRNTANPVQCTATVLPASITVVVNN